MPSERHPRGLYVLFFTEMWERFSYYGMRALLILYLVNYFKWTQEDASKVYKWYTSLVYMTPILGGYLADRYLGNKRAVIIGAVLMAIGHFLMAFEALTVFYSALVFLILGNGFFKPNMSTQVGRLYPPNDARRDGAYTIFYMGINLGAFLSPIVCGWLAVRYGYHYGFAAAGVGMVCGLVVYLTGLRFVVEIDPEAYAAGPGQIATGEVSRALALSEEEAGRAPSVTPALNRAGPTLVSAAGYALVGLVTLMGLAQWLRWSFGAWIAADNLISLGITSACALIASWILFRVSNGVRDRVLAIYVIALFVIFFWAAFEQAGNAMNLWADKTTNRYFTAEANAPSIYPIAPDDSVGMATSQGVWATWVAQWNPVPTAWFQSINALALFLLAPFFAMLWTRLQLKGRGPSIPIKMAAGILSMSLAFGLMVFAARSENQPSSTAVRSIPDSIAVNAQGQVCERGTDGKLLPFHAGRLRFDSKAAKLELRGVLPDTERDRIARATAPAAFAEKAMELREKSEKATGDEFEVTVVLDADVPGLDLRYAGLKPDALLYDPAPRTLKVVGKRLAEKDVKGLLVAAADPAFRDSLNDLLVKSSAFRVSPWWLFWFYILSTVGELCLSPVGLSMVSKLAPARFATMLMGLWLLTNAFGNFVAGAMGEIWGTVAPEPYFFLLVGALGGAAVVLFFCSRKIVAMMHGVN